MNNSLNERLSSGSHEPVPGLLGPPSNPAQVICYSGKYLFMSSSSNRPLQSRDYRQIWWIFAVISLVMHIPSLFEPHLEGDEEVYLTLAKQMNWDLSHYTTKDDPDISQFPNSIYRSELFHHPPLYPLVLKIGATLLGNAALTGLLFSNAVMALMLYYVSRWMAFSGIPPVWALPAFAGVTFCPLLLSSTMLLHHDAIMGCLMACGLVAYIEALRKPSVAGAVAAALLLTLGLNVRYNSILFLPCLIAIQVFAIRRTRTSAADGKTQNHNSSNWLVFGIVMAFVMTVGLQHFYRILFTYGSLLPSAFLIQDANSEQFSAFLAIVAAQTRGRTAIELALIYPVLTAFLIPFLYVPVVRSLREKRFEFLFTPIFLYLLIVEFYFSYTQPRYFATITPCLYLGLPTLIRNQSSRIQSFLFFLCGLSLLFMITTGYEKSRVAPPDAMRIIPSTLHYFGMY
ncbi:MAG: glycosyltransferase family 39 protein [Planctomyces sp.]